MTRVAAASLFLVLMAGLTMPSARAAEPGRATGQPSPPAQARYPGGSPGMLAPATTQPVSSSGSAVAPAAAFTCGNNTFYADGDYVHITDGAVSGHGWWQNISCPFPQATIKIWLQAYYTDGIWRVISAAGVKKNGYSGGGSANRANARVLCREFVRTVSYRSFVDVDIQGANDPADVYYTPSRDLRCTI